MRWLIAVSAVLLAGCSAHGGIQTAHGIGEGNFQGAVEPGAFLGASSAGIGGVPTLNFAGRYGISDKVDLGLRFGSTLYELTGKVQFMGEGPDTQAGSVAPSLSYFGLKIDGEGATALNLRTPVLFGIPQGENQLVVGPNLGFTHLNTSLEGTTTNVWFLAAGGQVAYSAKLGDNFRLHPELALLVPVVFGVGATSTTTDLVDTSTSGVTASGTLIGLNLGLLFGGN